MSWIDKILPTLGKEKREKQVPRGLWLGCPSCGATLYHQELEENLNVCPRCEHHLHTSARRRLDIFLDEGATREELAADVLPQDRLKFKDVKTYKDRLREAKKKTGETDALVACKSTLKGMPLVAVAFEFGFQGGSMGYAVGERFTRAAGLALKQKIPLVCFSSSGGARMQEGIISLMQLPKTSAILQRMKAGSVPFVSVLTDPVYGGVSASLALLGDLIIAEPGVRAGFAGPNIVRDSMHLSELPKGFQSSDFLLKHGAIDDIVPRHRLRDYVHSALCKLLRNPPPPASEGASSLGQQGAPSPGKQGPSPEQQAPSPAGQSPAAGPVSPAQ